MFVGAAARPAHFLSALIATIALALGGLVVVSPSVSAADDCTPLSDADLAFGAPYLSGTVTSGSDACYTVAEPGGARLYVGSMTEYVEISVYSAPTEGSPEGSRLCYVEYRSTCRLPENGPVTVRVNTFAGWAIDYEAQLLRLASDSGCPPRSTAAFGQSGEAVASATLGPNEAACWDYELTAGNHAVNQVGVDWAVYDALGEPVCAGGSRCAIPENGSYVLAAMGTRWQSEETPVAKALTLVDLTSTQGCDTVVDLSWTGDVVRVEDTSPLELHCRTVAAQAADRIGHGVERLDGASWRAVSSVVDAAGNPVCEQAAGVLGCELTGAPPYRLLARTTATSGGFQAAVRSFEPDHGCPVVDADPFGASAADDPFPAVGCGQLVVDAAASAPYVVRADSVYDDQGQSSCNSTSFMSCALAPGRHWLFTSYFPGNERPTVHDLRSSEGCVEREARLAQRDLQLEQGIYDCSTLTLPEGATVSVVHSDNTDDPHHGVVLVDGDGTLCGAYRYAMLTTCRLTGPPPYRVLVGGGASAHDKVAFLDLAQADACAEFPGGRLSPASRPEVTLTAAQPFSCLRVPAEESAPAEIFRFQRTQGVGTVRQYVVKQDGRACLRSGERGYVHCGEQPVGTGYTAILAQQADEGDNTYRLSRYGTSADTEGCLPVDSTALGAPGTGGRVEDFLDSACLKVTADPGDRIWVDARDDAGEADMFVFDSDGVYQCKTLYQKCVVTGSTSYQLILQTQNDSGVPELTVDAWTLETDEGITPECVRYDDYATGFGPLEATLTEQQTGACVVLESGSYRESYALDLQNTEGGTSTPVPGLVKHDTDYVSPCSPWSAPVCSGLSDVDEPRSSFVVFPLPEGVERLPFRVTGSCKGVSAEIGCGRIFKVFGASPLTARSDSSATVTVEGRKLSNTEARLVREGHDPVEAQATTVDDRAPAFDFDLMDVAPGPWTLEVHHPTDGTLSAPEDFVVDEGLLTSVEAPEVRGDMRVDDRVRAYEGTWSAEPQSFTYQWHVNGEDVEGATYRSMRLRPWMRDDLVTVTVTADAVGYVEGSATSTSRPVYPALAPRIVERPRVKGIKRAGRWVRVTNGNWDKQPRRYSFRWFVDGKRLGRQTGRRVRLRRWMVGKRIEALVIAHRPGYLNGRAWSYRYRVRR